MVDRIGWMVYAVVVLLISGVVGMHLGRFREAYTEMTGMMAGMTMGMLNGFVLGYCAAAATSSMFWGNLFGILLGLTLGALFGRAGGLMGIMDGGMGGVMGGSMGAMLAIMLAFPREAIVWTALLLGLIYVAGMVGLIVLIEQSAPEHAALHRLLPMFTRAVSIEAAEAGAEAEERGMSREESRKARAGAQEQRRVIDYYAFLGVARTASQDQIAEAYLEKRAELDNTDERTESRLERALAVLTHPAKRQMYDQKLSEKQAAVALEVETPANKGATIRVAPTPRFAHVGNVDEEAYQPGRQGASEPPKEPIAARRAGGPSHGNGFSGGNSAPASPVRASNGGSNGPGTPGKSQALRQGKEAQEAKTSKGGGQRQERRGNQARGNNGRARGTQQQQVRYARKQTPAQQKRVAPVSWVGGVAFVLILFAVGWWVFSAGATRSGGILPVSAQGGFVGSSGQTQAQLEQGATVAIVGADGKQTVDVVLNSATFQYEPKVVKVKQGTPVHFNLSVVNGDPG